MENKIMLPFTDEELEKVWRYCAIFYDMEDWYEREDIVAHIYKDGIDIVNILYDICGLFDFEQWDEVIEEYGYDNVVNFCNDVITKWNG